LRRLSEYSVLVRYPGETADKESAQRSFKICTEIRRLARASLGMKD
jgi:hypothetical protein